jgi:hypothetical protein
VGYSPLDSDIRKVAEMKTETQAVIVCIVLWFGAFFYFVGQTSDQKVRSCSPDYTQPDSMAVVCK